MKPDKEAVGTFDRANDRLKGRSDLNAMTSPPENPPLQSAMPRRSRLAKASCQLALVPFLCGFLLMIWSLAGSDNAGCTVFGSIAIASLVASSILAVASIVFGIMHLTNNRLRACVGGGNCGINASLGL